MQGNLGFVIEALYLMIPVYFANMSPVFFAKIFPRLDIPVDFGKKWKDGKPIFGASKTWRGLIFGSLVSGCLACGLAYLANTINTTSPKEVWLPDFGLSGLESIWLVFLLGTSMGLGALFGDLIKSFFKRRVGKDPGERWFGPDQLDFILGAWLFAWLISLLFQFGGTYPGNWFVENFLSVSTWKRGVFALASIFLLHPFANWIGYLLKLKKVPW
jgi:CDP-2,3-bis-(O-geranylgeranyl)-sn-glycerol synthase